MQAAEIISWSQVLQNPPPLSSQTRKTFMSKGCLSREAGDTQNLHTHTHTPLPQWDTNTHTHTHTHTHTPLPQCILGVPWTGGCGRGWGYRIATKPTKSSLLCFFKKKFAETPYFIVFWGCAFFGPSCHKKGSFGHPPQKRKNLTENWTAHFWVFFGFSCFFVPFFAFFGCLFMIFVWRV